MQRTSGGGEFLSKEQDALETTDGEELIISVTETHGPNATNTVEHTQAERWR